MLNKTSSFDQLSFNFGVTQENKTYVVGIKMKDNESEWLQGNECIVCDLNFSKSGKPHHCRVCGNSVCKNCSYKMVNDKRSCDLCFKRIQLVDQEKLKKQQIKSKKESIKELKNQIQKQQEKNDQMKNQLIELQKQFERQEREHAQQEKPLEDQFDQKINMIRQQIENNNRLDENIKGERIQLEEIEREIIDLHNNIQKKGFDIKFANERKKEFHENLQKHEKHLKDLQQSLEQKQQEYTEIENRRTAQKQIISEENEKNEKNEKKSSDLNKEQKHKENCIIY
ncbi:unnamed protein product (macronuclear) [Paramecium tetraurelia]|uniref:FYVE-type domain-containing protein n=1 Tax=Paramecium tetraurelia TaxID=5888 RepID=A0C500_PARTE|nr:uncharacterized protein GSPATT00006366001 [Paramecium tetraurelia]CAK65867.1 unnamed protein product [Paramecium tetraurelia]|eukprot:XP_001433264.1 hypothetical protein (macronuclear) [Paramecium tetraurelia strain d4-2]